VTEQRLAYPEREAIIAKLAARYVDAFHTAISAGLKDSHFTVPVPAAIWAATRELRESGKKVGFVELTEKLRSSKHLAAAQALLREAPPTATEPEVYAHAEKIVAAAKARAAAQGTVDALRELEAADDPQEALGVFMDRAFELTMEQTQVRKTRTPAEAMVDLWRDIYDPTARHRTITGIPLGIRVLDDRLRGCQMGKVTLVGARPGVGKTAFLTSALAKLIEGHDPAEAPMPAVLFESLEMSDKELVTRLTMDIARVPASVMLHGSMPDLETMTNLTRAADLIVAAPLDIDDRSGRTVEQICANIWRWRRRRWPKGTPKGAFGCVFIDYLTRIKKTRAAMSLQEHVTHCMDMLATCAKDTGLAIVLLSQLTRAFVNEGRWPDMGDLKGGGEIEENAFAVVLLHALGKSEDAAQSRPWRGSIAAIIDKNRAGSPGGFVMLHYAGELYSFRAWNLETDGLYDDVMGQSGVGRGQQPARPQQRKPKQEALPSAPPGRGGPQE
jgi:replicative DNA helicase